MILLKTFHHSLKVLITFHTLTCCDITSFLAQHTKWTAWDNLNSDSDSIFIQNLGEDNLKETDFPKIEIFYAFYMVCQMKIA